MRVPGLQWYDEGQCAFHGAALELYRRLDRLFAGWAAECGAQEHVFPPFIPAAALERLDYFESFPHLATFPVALEAEASNLREFCAANKALGDGAVKLARIVPPREVLTPAACYHFYHGLQGARIAAATHLTTRATCFRRETHYAPLERQWSFSMREIVCLGTAGEVKMFLAGMQERLTDFFRRHELAVEWRAATDCFFDASRNPRYLAQRLDPVKSEMVFEDRLAIGSVNFHRNYFGEAFDIRRGDDAAFSGCVAFGLERWMHAFLVRYGTEERDWVLP
jgi:seryl-tRNA synthetase